MREIKFRGKRVDNVGWVSGYYVQDPWGRSRIYWKPFEDASSNTWHYVDPTTVGQFTGLKDKEGNEVYEGDICTGHSDGSGKISWTDFDGGYHYEFVDENAVGIWEVLGEIKIIGNIHDNPELLKP